jgi:hypothetical protein
VKNFSAIKNLFFKQIQIFGILLIRWRCVGGRVVSGQSGLAAQI